MSGRRRQAKKKSSLACERPRQAAVAQALYRRRGRRRRIFFFLSRRGVAARPAAGGDAGAYLLAVEIERLAKRQEREDTSGLAEKPTPRLGPELRVRRVVEACEGVFEDGAEERGLGSGGDRARPRIEKRRRRPRLERLQPRVAARARGSAAAPSFPWSAAAALHAPLRSFGRARPLPPAASASSMLASAALSLSP